MSRMCWGCGYDEVPDDEDYCPNCGDKVPCGKCPFCGADMYPSYQHICQLCGADVREDYAKHMAKVHAALAATESQKEETQSADTDNVPHQPPPEPMPLKTSLRLIGLWLSYMITLGVIVYTTGRFIGSSTDYHIVYVVLFCTTVATILLGIVGKVWRWAQRSMVGLIVYIIMVPWIYYGAFSVNQFIDASYAYRNRMYHMPAATSPKPQEQPSPQPKGVTPDPTSVRTPVIVENPEPNTQKAKDEADYSRGYDDGRFSAAEGIWEGYDENESEAYINGYQDGQGEAREELEDERQRQQAERPADR